MRIKLKSNKKYIFRSLLILSMVFLIFNLVGCSNKMSDTEMIECKKYKDSLPDNLSTVDYLVKEMVDNSSNMNGYKPILSNETWVETYDKNLNEISLENLELYHKNLKKYKNVENDNFQNIKYLYLLSQRKLSYAKEIISLCKDKDISSEDKLKIQNLGILSSIVANENDEDAFATSKKLIALQSEMDKKYKIDSNEIYLLQEIIND